MILTTEQNHLSSTLAFYMHLFIMCLCLHTNAMAHVWQSVLFHVDSGDQILTLQLLASIFTCSAKH